MGLEGKCVIVLGIELCRGFSREIRSGPYRSGEVDTVRELWCYRSSGSRFE